MLLLLTWCHKWVVHLKNCHQACLCQSDKIFEGFLLLRKLTFLPHFVVCLPLIEIEDLIACWGVDSSQILFIITWQCTLYRCLIKWNNIGVKNWITAICYDPKHTTATKPNIFFSSNIYGNNLHILYSKSQSLRLNELN